MGGERDESALEVDGHGRRRREVSPVIRRLIAEGRMPTLTQVVKALVNALQEQRFEEEAVARMAWEGGIADA